MIISSPLFKDLTSSDIEEFSAVNALTIRTFKKGDIILKSGEKAEVIGIVQSGGILIENIDPWGNKSTINTMGTGSVFAESYALSGESMMVDVVAAEESSVLFINIVKLLRENNSNKGWYIKLLLNLVSVTASKNRSLSTRIFCTTPKTIRERILTYLSGLYLKNGTKTFLIPFNREQMASYLNTDRTALSKELGKMKRDGLIDWHKNSFTMMVEPE